jgi:hypothetical protein
MVLAPVADRDTTVHAYDKQAYFLPSQAPPIKEMSRWAEAWLASARAFAYL